MTRWSRPLLVAVFLLGAALQAVDLWRPVDGRVREAWRECDVAGIARNFYREGMNIWYPRVDWRGDGPGYAEMEFPIYPWLIAVSYKTLGYHEILGRFIAYGFSLITLAVMLALAARLLPPAGAVAAGVFFALSPLVLRVGNAIQPEAFMLCAYVCAVYAFIRWLDARDRGESTVGWYVLAAVATALAILGKATAAHIGLLFAILLVQRRGWRSLFDPAVVGFAVIALLPGVIWYHHAHGFWLTYGNSLGVSNEDHWIGLDVLRKPGFALGLVISELYFVWMPTGLILGLFGLAMAPTSPAAKVAVPWYAAILIFYVATIRTTAASWALYYHIFSAAPVALLVGLGVAELARIEWRRTDWRIIGAGTLAAVIVVGGMLVRHLTFTFDGPRALILLILVVLVGCAFIPRHALAVIAAIAVPATALFLSRQVIADMHPQPELAAWEAAQDFKPLIAPNAEILTSGGYCSNSVARRLATNLSEMFYWLDRKGFNVCVQQQSLAAVTAYAARGAQYFVAKDRFVGDPTVPDPPGEPPFAAQLADRFPVLARSNGWSLYDLRKR
jgi:4-amino-4-deoxy-L-arabinose transferase-like glycosyltransferase